jgi:hypothetical protein
MAPVRVPLPKGPLAILFLLVGAAWSWILPLPLVAIDYSNIPYARALTTGEAPAIPKDFDPVKSGHYMADGFLYRPVQHTRIALESWISGGTATGMHVFALLWHLANAGLIYALLVQWLPAGAWWGALLGGLTPVAAQALCWDTARALVMCVGLSLAALHLSIRYLRAGNAVRLAAAASCLALSTGVKESGTILAALVGLIAPLATGRAFKSRTIGFLVTVAGTIACGLAIRILLGFGLPKGFMGLTYASPWHMVLAGAGQLPNLLLCGLAVTTAGGESLGWPGFLMAVILLAAAGVRGARGILAALAGAAVAAAASITDALVVGRWDAVETTREAYAAALLLWSVLGAIGMHALARAGRPALHSAGRWVILVFAGVLLYGHWRERELRAEIALTAGRWVEELSRSLDHLQGDRAPLGNGAATDPWGPAGFLVLGPKPDRPGFQPVIGPAVSNFMRPPFTHREWYGIDLPERAAAGSTDFLRTFPWDVLVFEAQAGINPPVARSRLPPLSGTLPRTASVHPATLESGYAYAIDLNPVPVREVHAFRLTFGGDLPKGTVLVFTRGQTIARTTLLTHQPAGRVFRWRSAAEPDFAFDGSSTAVKLEVLPPAGIRSWSRPSLEVVLESDFPSVTWLEPKPRHCIPKGGLPPPIRWRCDAPADRWILRVEAEGVFASAFPSGPAYIPASVVRRVQLTGGEALEVDLYRDLPISPDHWNLGLDLVRRAYPHSDRFWVRLVLEGTLGDPPWIQSVSSRVPVEVRY